MREQFDAAMEAGELLGLLESLPRVAVEASELRPADVNN